MFLIGYRNIDQVTTWDEIDSVQLSLCRKGYLRAAEGLVTVLGIPDFRFLWFTKKQNITRRGRNIYRIQVKWKQEITGDEEMERLAETVTLLIKDRKGNRKTFFLVFREQFKTAVLCQLNAEKQMKITNK